MTTFEDRLMAVLQEVAMASDLETATAIKGMQKALAAGDFAAVQSIYGTLRPIYRLRLGEPPSRHDGDKVTPTGP